MGIAVLSLSRKFHILRENELNKELTQLQSWKTLATYSQADLQSLLSADKAELRRFYKDLYEGDEALQELYVDYTDMPDFEEELDRITAEFQDQLDELTAWETSIDAQITTKSTELEEIKAYKESEKQMLTTNISEDFNFGLNN